MDRLLSLKKISRSLAATSFLFLLFLFPFSSCTCSQCHHDQDCLGSELCLNGVCQPLKKPPKRRTPIICIQGERRRCYNGPIGTENVGICKSGHQICQNNAWGPCLESVLPAAKEECDKIDNNCNGKVDEGCHCINGTKQKCYTGSPSTRNKGLCLDGEQICINGQWGTCVNQRLPQAETCDNQDNDCNGLIDDNVKKPCKTQCGLGEEICVSGKFLPCNAPKPTKEICGDNKDNDCDGSTDEGCECTPNEKRECYTGPPSTAGKGICKKGIQQCSKDGKWQNCIGQIIPKMEQCNGKDDDCNGKIDDNLKRPCHRGCNSGFEICSNGTWQPCNAAPAEAEICDGRDNDCNNKIDDLKNGQKCECTIGQKETCYTGPKKTLGIGPCKSGERICQSTGKWSLCLNQIIPIPEDCNGKDDDCDGNIDNNPGTTDALTRYCYEGPPNTAGKGECKRGVQRCQNKHWLPCKGQQQPKKEECNGKDDNCDGQIDENLKKICYSGKAGTAGKGECKKGITVCHNGSWSTCQGEVTPTAEICNKKDDDCDGSTDEDGVCDVCKAGEKQACYTGPSNTRHVTPCKDGISYCVAGQWGTCHNEIKPKKEQCNNIDDDCNGKIDDGLTQPCKSACGTGRETCVAGHWVNCNAPKPKKEICNNFDDDCNGKIDDGIECTILATGDWDGDVFVWNPFSFKKLFSTKNYTRINQLRFSPNKQFLAVATRKDVRIWYAETGLPYRTISNYTNNRSIAFSPDNKYIAIGNDKKRVEIRSVSTGSLIRSIYHSSYVRVVAYHPQNKWLLSGSSTTLYFWNPSTGRKISSISIGYTIASVSISKDGRYLLTAGNHPTSFKPYAHRWDITSLPPRQIISYPIPGYIYSIAFSQKGNLATMAYSGGVMVWNVLTNQNIVKISQSNAWFYSSAITPDNRYLAAGGRKKSSRSGRLYIWDITTTPPIQKFYNSSHKNYLGSLTFRE